MQITALLAAVGLASLAQASPKPVADKSYQMKESDIHYNVFEHAATQSTMKYVNNSGICETTPGVNQYSGYIDVGAYNSLSSPSLGDIPTNLRGPSLQPAHVVLVLRGPPKRRHGSSRCLAQRWSWLQLYDRPVPGERPLHLQRRQLRAQAQPQLVEQRRQHGTCAPVVYFVGIASYANYGVFSSTSTSPSVPVSATVLRPPVTASTLPPPSGHSSSPS